MNTDINAKIDEILAVLKSLEVELASMKDLGNDVVWEDSWESSWEESWC